MSSYMIEETIGPEGEIEYSYRGWRLERVSEAKYGVLTGVSGPLYGGGDMWIAHPPYELDYASFVRIWPGTHNKACLDTRPWLSRPCAGDPRYLSRTIEAAIDRFEDSLEQHRAAAWAETAERLGWVSGEGAS